MSPRPARKPLRIAVLADTHLPRGSRRLPDLCRHHLAESDLIVHAGDLTSRAFLAELRGIGPHVHVVAGNADEPALAGELPETLAFEAHGVSFGVVHDAGPRPGREERLLRRFPDCGALIYGHTHLPQTTLQRGVWILNPGSPTERRRSEFRSMLLLELVPGGELLPQLLVV
jgi:putative phosphoesterase